MNIMIAILLAVGVFLVLISEVRAYRRERRYRKLVEHKRRLMRSYLGADRSDTE